MCKLRDDMIPILCPEEQVQDAHCTLSAVEDEWALHIPRCTQQRLAVCEKYVSAGSDCVEAVTRADEDDLANLQLLFRVGHVLQRHRGC